MAPRFVLKEKPLFRPPSWGESPGAELRFDTRRVSQNPKCLKNLNLLTNGVLGAPFVFYSGLSNSESGFMKECICAA